MNTKQCEEELREYRAYFYQFDFPVVVYLHWTAGKYFTTFHEYHYCIDGDGEIISTKPLNKVPSATWNRNTGSIAISLCCCYDATTADLGDYPPTDAQIESAAQLMAAISDVFDIPIDSDHFMTHGEVADIDGYGIHDSDPDMRWDLHILHTGDEWGSGGDILRGKALWYQNRERGIYE